jgi:RNA-directed DNA polymerase
MSHHQKRAAVMPARASYGTAREAGSQTSERPIGRTPELGAEPRVWTERMLAALDKGVKGGKWYSLIDKVYPEAALRAAFTQVAANRGAAGVDHVTIVKYTNDLDANLARLSEALRSGTYRPQRIRRHYIPKPGSPEKRPLGIPTVQDRVVQTALRTVLEPIFERDFAPHSYGFRPGRGCKDALRRVNGLLKAGYSHVVDADLKSYFDTIPKDRLLALVGRKVSDGRILRLVEAFLEQGVLDGLEEWTPVQGTPQGAVCSPLLSNIYLDPLDHVMAGRGFEMVRYADDFVVLCRNPQEAAAALAVVQQWTAEAGLTLHPTKTRVVNAEDDGFEFLGYRFAAGRRRPRAKSLKKFKDTVRSKTKRTAGHSLSQIIENLNRTLRGWFEYFKHSHRSTFAPLDGWIRRRLRNILRKQNGRSGISRASDNIRWPNAFFAAHGLFSLADAYAQVRQSSCR